MSDRFGLMHGDFYAHNVLIGRTHITTNTTTSADNGGNAGQQLLRSRALLSDFGSSFFYEKFGDHEDNTKALCLAGMEVRAWAILSLENVNFFMKSKERLNKHDQHIILKQLPKELLNLLTKTVAPQNPQSRPRFSDIVMQLEGMMA
eukprot:CAMPEP_0171309628 /NCGR_PEP_ID=MMETSP0816-20121228/19810_1 /TAXON_ID=420281 /ORGANISM="Proboscia inermis, Strain CCAP1064/1" /LENGTH=146 /DNA_ID=CAMNT_0011793303 /DNA_START=102 /DNA_END=542 /DNA_ORIENTATION=+